LGFPGGPAIERAAAVGTPGRFDLPRAWLSGSYDFSFSGLKTALLRLIEPYRQAVAAPRLAPPPARPTGPFPEHRPVLLRRDTPVADLALAFQDAVVDVLAVKTADAAREFSARTVLLAGGVAANTVLRRRLRQEVGERVEADVDVRYPPLKYCTDNAAMVAGAGYFSLRRGAQVGWETDVIPRLALT
jgi:N6-L-threonylcarbamoyladenine synthase